MANKTNPAYAVNRAADLQRYVARQGAQMRIAKVLSVGKFDPEEKGIDLTRALSADERVSLVEDLRRQMSKVTQSEYPRRLRRVLEIARRATG